MIHIVSFANTPRFLNAQALQNHVWEKVSECIKDEEFVIHAFNEESFKEVRELDFLDSPIVSDSIRKTSKTLTEQYPRGYGLWSWKLILINYVFHHIAKDEDLVFYVDSGACVRSIDIFKKLIEEVRLVGYYYIPVKFFENAKVVEDWLRSVNRLPEGITVDPEFPLCQWDGNHDYTKEITGFVSGKTPQICGGFQFYKKGSSVMELTVKQLCTLTHDIESLVGEGKGSPKQFIEHRHDQAILSFIMGGHRDYKDYSGAFCLHRGNI